MKDLAVITALNHSGYFEKNFVEFKNILKMLFTSQGRSVKGKTLPSFKTSGKVFPIRTYRLANNMCVLTNCAVFWRARMTSQNTNNNLKYSAILYSKTSKKICIIQLLFFCYIFLPISHKRGKAKRIKKRSARSWLVKQAFLQYKITKLPNKRTILQVMCTLFARYLFSSKCSTRRYTTALLRNGFRIMSPEMTDWHKNQNSSNSSFLLKGKSVLVVDRG